MSLLNQIVSPAAYVSAGTSVASAVVSKTVESVTSSSNIVETTHAATKVILTTNRIGAIGLIVGIATFAVNFYFKRRQDKRQQEEHDIYMKNHQ